MQPKRHPAIGGGMDRPVDPQSPSGMTGTLRENIARLTERQRQERAAASLADKLADAITGFTGSMLFVLLHIVLFGGWIVWNLWGDPKFDPSFVVLAMVASVEAIFLSTFVLISQNRMAEAADRRADLDLHINLLAEHELTKLAELVERIADKVGVPASEPEFTEIKQDVEPVKVLDALDARKRAEGLEG